MKHIRNWIGLLLLALVPAVAAQETTPEPAAGVGVVEWLTGAVQAVSVIEQAGTAALRIEGRLPGTCEPVERTAVQRVGVALYVDLYRTLNPAIRCMMTDTPFELIVPVPELLTLAADATLPQYLIVNDAYFGLSFAAIEPVGTPPAVPPVMLVPLPRQEDIQIDGLAFSTVDAALQLTVQATTGGCADPLLLRLWLPPGDTVYTLQAYRLYDAAVVTCPSILTQHEIIVPAGLPADQPLTVLVGEEVYRYMPTMELPGKPTAPAAPEGQFRAPHVINSVTVVALETDPVQYEVRVSGYQSDGCDFPVQIEQTRGDSAFQIDIFRLLPADVLCPMIVLDYSASLNLGPLPAGSYTVAVNGVTTTFVAR
ncbi:MAG: hypothetical protein MUE40_20725 [Anaerolineae bacterium]|nr:hypothetical protein [Anaerolineae bacterium]